MALRSHRVFCLRGVSQTSTRQTGARRSLHGDVAGHYRTVNGAVIRVCARGTERTRVRAATLRGGVNAIIERDVVTGAPTFPGPCHRRTGGDLKRRRRELVVRYYDGVGHWRVGDDATAARARSACRRCRRGKRSECNEYTVRDAHASIPDAVVGAADVARHRTPITRNAAEFLPSLGNSREWTVRLTTVIL